MSFPGLQPGMSVVVHRERYAACFKLPVHSFWEYLHSMSEHPSSSLRQLLRDAPITARGSAADLARGRDLSPKARHALEALVAWTGHGLPKVGDWDFAALLEGETVALDAAGPPCLVIARSIGGAKVLLRQRGFGVFAYDKSVVRERGFLPTALIAHELRLGMTRAAPSLLDFLERLAVELQPSPALGWWSTFMRPRDKRRTALAKRLGVAPAPIAGDLYSDDRFYIGPHGIGLRDSEALEELLRAASTVGVELHLWAPAATHPFVVANGELEALSTRSYKHEADWAQLSAVVDGGLAEQTLTVGGVVVQRVSWLDGQAEIERLPCSFPSTWWADPVVGDYLQRRHALTLEAFRGGDAASFPASLEDTVRAIEDEAGGLVALDDLRPWRLIAVRPLIAPLHLARALPAESFRRTVMGVPLWVVGEIGTVHQLALDEQGRWYRVHRFHAELEPAGDDVLSTLRLAALDDRRARSRHARSVALFIDDDTLARIEAGLTQPPDVALDTWALRCREGDGFELRTRKSTLGSAWPTPHELYVDHVDVLLRLVANAPGETPMEIAHDDKLFLPDEDIARCKAAGLVGFLD